ncbi:MAG: glutathione S-transferase family protein [Steroidobacteraceae bacterium]
MLQILGRSTSINVRKVLWLCQELELPYELQQWGAGQLPTEAPEFRALNPNALVPVIRDGSFVLWESNAICRYLAAAHGEGNLLPADLQERALVEQWMDWQATELNNSWRYAFMALVRRSAAHTDKEAVAAGVRNWNRHMTMLDEQLRTSGAFVTGASFTVADIVLGLATNRWFMTPMERPALPAVTDYYERLSQRPAFRAHGRNGVP